MAANVLDRSSWSPEALARWEAMEAEKAARKAHPLAGLQEKLSPEAWAASNADRWHLKARCFGNGHRECVVWRETPDIARDAERMIDADVAGLAPAAEAPSKEDNVERAVRRAKQRVRHLCKAMIVNSLWTLTYRANVTDRALVLAHLKEFVRRTRRVLGEWRYIAVLEKQERGALHVHIATHALPRRILAGGVRLKSWDVMRSIWRSVVGDLGGNFDEAKRKRRNGQGFKRIQGAGSIARYIAGYVAKDMHESEAHAKRFSHSVGIDVPAAYKAVWMASDVTMRELVELAFSAVGDRVTSAWFDAERGVFFIETDDTEPIG
jgi:hypothetical protein